MGVQLLKGREMVDRSQWTRTCCALRREAMALKRLARTESEWGWVRELNWLVDALDREILRDAHDQAVDQLRLIPDEDVRPRRDHQDAAG